MTELNYSLLYRWYWHSYYESSAHIQYGRFVAAQFLETNRS